MLEYPSRIKLAQTPTPLQCLDRISERLGGPRIWMKRDDLTGSALSGNKIRKLEFVVAQALEEGCDTLITCGGLQSNHCRATAIVAAQLGLKVCLILRDDGDGEMDGNLFLDHLSGANINIFPRRDYFKNLNQYFDQFSKTYLQAGNKPFLIPTGASDEIGIWGYIAACEELKKDFSDNNISPKTIVTASGSGGTQAGLTAGSDLHNLNADVIGFAVCDDQQYFIDKVNKDLSAWYERYGNSHNIQCDITGLKISVNADYIGPGYARADKNVFDMIAELASTEGVFLDPVYTGKAFYGLVSEIKAGKFQGESDVVFIHTGGIFGLFPQRKNFSF